ncbi:uncharacterized protein LOC143418683 isoform X2 [Maylandia zebra]|uniref:uncharacterized protein LOC143418683 isoform X2 n=1 Tax=Maylandia zebra TaxID=106582 RepID=UPI00403C080F
MDHDLKHESEEKNGAEDAKASHEVATIRRIYRLEALEKLREDVTSIIEHFMEDGFLESDGGARESDGGARESDGGARESDGGAREREFSESEPEMLPDQTFPEEQPVASSVYPAREVVTLSEANMDHDLKHESEEKNGAEDAKASHEVATIHGIYRPEALEKLREDVTSIIEHFMEDGFPVLDRFMEEFLESDGDTTESDGDTRESEFSESEPEMLPDQTFPEEQPVTSSVYPAREVVTLSEGKQTVAPEGKPQCRSSANAHNAHCVGHQMAVSSWCPPTPSGLFYNW